MRASPAPAGVLASAFAVAGVALPGAAIASANPLVHTYSIVARDPATGEMGVAVQSHWFSVGSIVTWAEAGVGAVATQSFVEPAYGPKGLELMRQGVPAPEGARAARRRGRRAQRPPGGDDRRDRRRRRLHRPRRIAAAGHHVGAQYSRPGQHDGQADGVAGDGQGVRGRDRTARRSPDRRARSGRGARAATSAAGSRRRC